MWEGKIMETGGAYAFSMKFTSMESGIIKGLATSTNASFFCETAFSGVFKDSVLLLHEDGVTKTNFPSRNNICLLAMRMEMKKNQMTGTFTSSTLSPASPCGSGKVMLKLMGKQTSGVEKTVAAMPPLSAEIKAGSTILLDSVFLDDEGNRIDVVIDDAQVRLPPREVKLINSLEFNEDSVHIAVYDNGIVDGDEISLYVNGEIRFNRAILGEKPLILELNKTDVSEFEIRFHANSLGSMPPNTGLIIITAGSLRRELGFSSDFTQSSVLKIKLNG
ncbi:MAG: hypothetical protein RLZZ557_265 [Bacteroidota bacterium]